MPNRMPLWALYTIFLSIGFLFVTVMLTYISNQKLNELRTDQAVLAYLDMPKSNEISKDLECLAKNIYWESKHEPFEGKVAVAQVTLNRVADSRWPDNICGVVYERNKIYSKVICQFSWVCEPGKITKKTHPELYAESMRVAKKVYLENFRLPSLHDALFYHADYVNPRWGKPKIIKIGRHIFYRDREA